MPGYSPLSSFDSTSRRTNWLVSSELFFAIAKWICIMNLSSALFVYAFSGVAISRTVPSSIM